MTKIWKVCRKCGTECNCDYFEVRAQMQEDFMFYFNHIRKDFIYELKHYLEHYEDKEEMKKEDLSNIKRMKDVIGQRQNNSIIVKCDHADIKAT